MIRALRRLRWKRIVVVASAAFVALAVAIGAHVGWFREPDGWERATGWDRIAPLERPSGGLRAALGPEAPEILWLGHSGFRIAWGGTTVLLDPNTSAWCTIARRVLEPPMEAERLGPADLVLISHAHFDHLDLPTLRALGRVGTLVLPAGSETVLEGQAVRAERVRPVVAGDRVRVGDVEVVAVPAAHNGGRLHPFRGRAPGLGYVLRREGRTIYYAGDTGFSNDFAAVRRDHAPEVAILPIGAYAPRFPMRHYHLSPEEAVEAARILDAALVLPCHFGTFTLSLDRPDRALPRFARAAARAGVRWDMPRLWMAGEALDGGGA